MRKFLVSSAKYKGEVELLYNAEELLSQIVLDSATLSQPQRQYILRTVPMQVAGLQAWKDSLTIVEADFEVSFMSFWTAYALKRNKLDAQKLWDKLSKTNQVQAWKRITVYNAYLKRHTWQQKMYPDTWLRGRHWEDEWETL